MESTFGAPDCRPQLEPSLTRNGRSTVAVVDAWFCPSHVSRQRSLEQRCTPAGTAMKDRELASKYYHSTHVSVSPRITQVAVTQ